MLLIISLLDQIYQLTDMCSILKLVLTFCKCADYCLKSLQKELMKIDFFINHT